MMVAECTACRKPDGAEKTRMLGSVRKALHCAEINRLESMLAQCDQQRLPLHHLFAPGLYCREVMIPKGTLCTTKIHKTEHVFVISKGEVSIWTKDGGVVRLGAPFTGVTKPGTRRVIFAHENTIFSTFHPTTETDLDRIEAQLIEPHDFPFRISKEGIAELKALCIR